MKKILSIILAITCIFTLPLHTFALIDNASKSEEFLYVLEDGTNIHYYFDEEGLPYIVENGKKVYICLPLPQFKITDEKVLNELNEEIQAIISNDNLMITSIPENYFDLTVTSIASKSLAFSQYYSFANSTTHTTPVFRMNPNHSKIRFRTKDIEKPLFGSNEVSFIIRLYSTTENAWYSFPHNDVSCTGLFGEPHAYVSTFNYAKYTLLIPDDVTAYTAVIWTTYD